MTVRQESDINVFVKKNEFQSREFYLIVLFKYFFEKNEYWSREFYFKMNL